MCGFSNTADCDARENLERNFYEPVENFYCEIPFFSKF